KEILQEKIKEFTGEIDQYPPLYSAIHVDGKRLSDLARSGKSAQIPSRKITVFSSDIVDLKYENGMVKYALVNFHVSKGTYIRSLARDLGRACNSCAHLIGLRRTKVGNFCLEDACGYEFLDDFNIENVLKNQILSEENSRPDKDMEMILQKEVKDRIQDVKKDLAQKCGFQILNLKSDFEFVFFNGQKLNKKMFLLPDDYKFEDGVLYAVFSESGKFSGLVKYHSSHFEYCYVMHE
ncbi:MAG: hypothetical protein K5839_07920, partial [Treponemataceae bacterium]|nr:hypothetical protein [Treponemataceae bacterium]